jgi:hypothetical protein
VYSGIRSAFGGHRNHGAAAVLVVEVRLDRPLAGIGAALAAALCAALVVCLAAAPAGAAPTLSGWSAVKVDAAALTGISCASETLCVAVDGEGHALIGTNPAADAASAWSRVPIPGAAALTGISCWSTPGLSNALCVAVDKDGDALISTNPATDAASAWSRVPIPGASALTAVSCASQSLCVAVGGSDAFVSSNPTAGASSTWSEVEIDKGHALDSVSCAAGLPCVAVDDAGRELTSNEPAGTWHARGIDSLALTAISCSSAPAGVCVAVDELGEALASADVAAPGGPTWSATPIDQDGLGAPTGVSCAAAGLCVFVDGGGGAYVGDDPTAAVPSWTFTGIDPGTALAGVACVSEGLCAAAGGAGAGAGQVLIARVPPPTAVTGTPTAAETSATLGGAVNPEDATLTSCRFEYGPSEAYGHSEPCASPLPTGGAAQAVSATLSGLTANTTYHYRLVVGSASGEARTPDATFKTTAPPLVQPHPSIGGIPAPGQRLTCKSGVSATSSATLGYAWLRDTKAIAGANGSTYTVAGADVSHHLQCRVTATNAGGSASATSAFVTVPAGGLGSISETKVGTLRVAGATVSVPLTCSAQAAGSCTIAVRLTVVETLRGGHVIAVAARTLRRTVTIGANTVRLPAGQQRTVTVTLNATGRHLLAHLHRLAAKLSVSGTVVGTISAPLLSATVTLTGAGRASSHHRR